jgi:Peptidase family M28
MAQIHPESLRAEIRFLSDDQLQGRGTATPGYELAAKYMASQFESLGLQPAGDNGTYFQSVPLHSALAQPKYTSFAWTAGGRQHTLVDDRDVLVLPHAYSADSSVGGPVVFVGYGVSAPELNHDDYAGLDLKGKIIAFVYGAPPQFDSSLRAYYSDSHNKLKVAADHGAVGAIELDDPGLQAEYPFAKYVDNSQSPTLWWKDKSGAPHATPEQIKVTALMSVPEACIFLEGAGHSADQIYAAQKDGSLKGFDTPIRASIHVSTTVKEVQSPNVVGILPGGDPSLRDQYVVFSAHLDHLGIGPAVKCDSIYHGALDNGSGSADLIEIARAAASLNPRPRRSMLFIAATGEETGLLGSDYFANNPTVPKSSMVADVNVDEDLMLWPLQDIIEYGAEHSSLAKLADQAGARLGLTMSPDPQPEEVLFIRSDQYSFVLQGVPSIFPSAGWKSSNPAVNPQKIEDDWDVNFYHTPQDSMNQPFNWDAGVKFARFSFLLGYLVAQQDGKPTWNPNDFFGAHYALGTPK